MGPAATLVNLDSNAVGFNGNWWNHQSVQSSLNAPVETTCVTNATGAVFWGWTDSAARACGRAEVGRLQLSAFGFASAAMTAAGTVAAADGIANAQTSWSDTFIINASPQLFGQLGELTVTIFIEGNLALASAPPQASVHFRELVRIYDSFGADSRLTGGTRIQRMNDGTLQTFPMDGALVGPDPRLWQLRAQFHFGRETYVSAWAEVRAHAKAAAVSVLDGPVWGEAASDFTNSVIWAGISDVRVAGCTAVTDFTITSGSGYDYLLGTITNAPVITRIQALPQGLALEWTDLGPRSYTVETAATLPAGSWSPVQGVAWPIHTNNAVLPLPGQSPAFFRVRVQ